MDTLRIRQEPDYFPLLSGLKLTYNHTSTEFDVVELVEVVFQDVQAFRTDCLARAVISRTRMGQTKTETYSVKKSAKEVFSENGPIGWGRLEYLLPALPGKEWIEEPDKHVIASIDERIETPSGVYMKCLRVNSFLGGGDAGSAIRYYAPGVGYVYEEYSGESEGARIVLTSFQMPKIARLD